ncbi:MAG: histidinol dehydrogenase [Thermoproteus sp.]
MREPFPQHVLEAAERIVDDVRQRGLAAALEWSKRLDGVEPAEVVVPPAPRQDVDPSVVAAALEAARSLERLYEKMRPPDIADYYEGVLRSVVWRPVGRAALYVPARYISTLIMLAVPARVAGVSELYVVTPPKGVTPELLAVAEKLGVKGVVALGGPQGLAYAAFGLGADILAGPGGLYVQAAKYVLSRYVGIDGIEGPTELVTYAEGVEPGRAVAGILAQLEHGPTSFALFLSRDSWLVEEVSRIYSMEKTSSMGPLEARRVSSLEEAARIIDEMAPEHLEVWGAPQLAYMVRNVGAISINAPSPLLDYAAGISHVLPTGGTARWRGIITPMTFMKPIGIAWPLGDTKLKAAALRLAEYEGFRRHADALR